MSIKDETCGNFIKGIKTSETAGSTAINDGHHSKESSNGNECNIETNCASNTVTAAPQPNTERYDISSTKYDGLQQQQTNDVDDLNNLTTLISNSNNSRKDSEERNDSDNSSTWPNKKSEKALVHRIVDDMQLAEYVNKSFILRTNPNHHLRLFSFVETGLRRAFWYLSKAIAAQKVLFVFLPITLVIVSLLGPYLHRNTISLVSPFHSFLPTTTPQYPSSGFSNLRIQLPQTVPFNGTNPTFSTLQRDVPTDFAVLIKSRNSSTSVLNNAALQVYANIHRSIHKITVKYKKSNYTWIDLCRESCSDDDDSILQLMPFDPANIITYPETIVNSKANNSATKRLFLGLSIGGVEADADGSITYARALNIVFKLRMNLKEMVLRDWDQQFHHIVRKAAVEAPKNANVDVYWWSNQEFTSDVENSFLFIHKTLIYSFATLIVLCCAFSFGCNSYQSRPVLGLMIGILLLVSAITGHCIQLTGSSNVNAAGFTVFFTLSGFGILLLFSLKDSWKKYSNAACDPVEKLSLLMCWEGPNKAIISMIIILAFLIIGSTTKNPFIQYITLVFAAAVAVLLIFTIFFFSVFLLVSGRREAKGLKWYQIFRYGDGNFPAKTIEEFDEIEVVDLHDKLLDAKPSFIRSMGKLASTAYMRCPIAFLFAVYLVFACWGCKDFRTDLNESYFLAGNSEARAYLENHQQLFCEYEHFLELVFHEPVDYSDPKRRDDILSLLDWAVRNRYVSKTMSWLKDFARFETSTIYDITTETFVPIISHVFLASEHFKKYHTDIILDKFETQILSSRMYLEVTEKGIAERTFLIENLLLQARAHEIPLFIKAPFAFSIQHDVQVTSTMLLCFGIFVCCVCVSTLICYGIPALTVLAVLSNVSVMIGVVGYASYWAIPLNIVTFSVALCGNVLATATTTYFCYCYTSAGKLQKTGESKVQYSFQSCLIPVTFACFIPLVMYLPLMTLTVPVVTHIFKILLLTSLITFAHFPLFIPSVMMFFAEQIPIFCSTIQSACDDCCCQCFEVEEDSGSIYYIPTSGRNKMEMVVDRTYPYLVSAPPPTISTSTVSTGHRMIMQPPPGYLQVSSPVIAPDVLIHRSIEAPRSRCQSSNRDSRSRRDSYSERSLSRAVSPRLIRSAHPTPLSGRKISTKKQQPECRSLSDSIYESPPSPSFDKRHRKDVEPIAVRKKALFRPNCEPDDFSISRRLYYDRFREDEADQNSVLEMRSNWRQYLIEGSLRQTSNLPKPPNPAAFHTSYTPSSRYHFIDNKRF